MADSLLEALALGFVAALSPLTLLAAFPTLGGPDGVRRAWFLLIGWITGLSVVIAAPLVFVELTGGADTGDPARWVDVVRLGAGVALLVAAAAKIRTHHRSDETRPQSSWLRSLGTATDARLAMIGTLLAVANLKVWALATTLAVAAADNTLALREQLAVATAFVLVGALGPGIPTIYATVRGAAAQPMLARMQAWVTRNETYLVAGVLALIGAAMLKESLQGW